MTRSRLKNVSLKNQYTNNWKNYKYQQKCFTNLLRKTKFDYSYIIQKKSFQRGCHPGKSKRGCHPGKSKRGCHPGKSKRGCHPGKSKRGCHPGKSKRGCHRGKSKTLHKSQNKKNQALALAFKPIFDWLNGYLLTASHICY